MAVTAHDALVQAGVADGAAGVREDGVGALDRAGSPLAAHHLVLSARGQRKWTEERQHQKNRKSQYFESMCVLCVTNECCEHFLLVCYVNI